MVVRYWQQLKLKVMDNNMNVTTKRNFFQKVGHAISNGAKKVWNAKAGKVAVGKIGTIVVCAAGTLYAAYSFVPGVKTYTDKTMHKLFGKKEQQEPAPENNGQEQ